MRGRASKRQLHRSARESLDVLVFVKLRRSAPVHARKPAPVCLAEGSSVILRPSGKMQKKWNLVPDEKAVFRMDRKTQRDLFVIQDGREFDLNRLPTGLLLDVMSVPAARKSSAPADLLLATV